MKTKPETQTPMKKEFIKHMVDRFLQWRLPENFNPDGGISFKKYFNEHTSHPMKSEPVGTNLFDATQAEEMVRYMIEGADEAVAPSVSPAPPKFCPKCGSPEPALMNSECLWRLSVKLDPVPFHATISQAGTSVSVSEKAFVRAEHVAVSRKAEAVSTDVGAQDDADTK